MTRPESAAIGVLCGLLTGLFTWLWLVAIHPPWALRRCAEAVMRLRAEVEAVTRRAEAAEADWQTAEVERARLGDAIERHHCSQAATWCGTHGQYHGDTLCAALTPPAAPPAG